MLTDDGRTKRRLLDKEIKFDDIDPMKGTLSTTVRNGMYSQRLLPATNDPLYHQSFQQYQVQIQKGIGQVNSIGKLWNHHADNNNKNKINN